MIPPIGHLLWIGKPFPWIYTLAIKSAVARGGMHRVIFHHSDDLNDLPSAIEVVRLPGVECRRLDPLSILEETGPGASRLIAEYRELSNPAAKANVLRYAILYLYGGVYLDTDTVTVADLSPLRSSGFFCGEEYIVYPYKIVHSHTRATRLKAKVLTRLRKLFSRLPQGYRLFRHLTPLYHRAVNNAVLGSEARHPVIRELLDRAAALPREQALRSYGLGTHLLQQTVRDYRRPDLVVHPPEVFYPLPPVISLHWFRTTRFPALGRIIQPTTRVVHWYASVSTARIIDEASPNWIRARIGRQLFSTLASPLLE